jgi:hypothetical protein
VGSSAEQKDVGDSAWYHPYPFSCVQPGRSEDRVQILSGLLTSGLQASWAPDSLSGG